METCGQLGGGQVVCTGGPSTAATIAYTILEIALFAAPIAVAAYLARRRSQLAVAT